MVCATAMAMDGASASGMSKTKDGAVAVGVAMAMKTDGVVAAGAAMAMRMGGVVAVGAATTMKIRGVVVASGATTTPIVADLPRIADRRRKRVSSLHRDAGSSAT
ncbi:hypothetical protein SAMN05444161_5177 [Rhizobiales bacterium GAS191]|nr:hypothetical protein SAMN05519103_04442 [Rhizobiales bacterium GAS113]SEE22617.1 hypothetical protein SAMN05444161_5177 [Rhizobiales bacterium GAS191]SEE33618.1 hypothetical protein SAMN05519104_5811 [Rhizobiales bacterium GAS188]